jgi:hypothetical protein
MGTMKIATASDVRATIAYHLFGADRVPATLGDITLLPHQLDGIERVQSLIESHGGALLADDVGLGKTFIALAVARAARDAVVVAPASLRDAWHAAARRAGVAVRFVSVQSLGRLPATRAAADLVIVDEAHHLRSRGTRRFPVACELCRGAKVLLMTATPVQNRLEDLRTILSLFLGERAHALSEDEMARYIVRRHEGDLTPSVSPVLPRVRSPEWLHSVADVDCLERLVALPPPLPPVDGDDGGALLTYTLTRQWASSRAALRAALNRRVARGYAMEDALRSGRLPSRTELTAWRFAEGVQQLTFPELAVQSEVPDAAELLARVREHAAAVRGLISWLDASPDPDLDRAQALRNVAIRHPGQRIVAFSEFAETVTALYRLLVPTARVAMLTHTGGRVVGGPLARGELLSRFLPGASLRTQPGERIDLLLTTDVLSEGVDLQDASVVAHLDLSWNPARMEQRVGRLRRLGAAGDTVAVYVFAPPAPAERLLQLERRLRHKIGVAARSVGVAGAILPGFAPRDAEGAAPRGERIVAAIRGWRRHLIGLSPPIAAAVRALTTGAIVCVRSEGEVSLLAVKGEHVTDSPGTVEALLSDADGEEVDADGKDIRAIVDRVENWLRHRRVSDVVDLPAMRVAHSRRVLLRRVDTIGRRAPRHVQPRLAPLMRAARTAATATLSAGAERVLDELARAPMSDEAWLHAIGEFASLNARTPVAHPPEILALLLLRAK